MGIALLTIKVLNKDIMIMNNKQNIQGSNINININSNSNNINNIIKQNINKQNMDIEGKINEVQSNNNVETELYYTQQLIDNMTKFNNLTQLQINELNNTWNNSIIDIELQKSLLQNITSIEDNATNVIINTNDTVLQLVRNHPVLQILKITITTTSIYCAINNMTFVDGIIDLFNKDEYTLANIAKTIIITNMNEIKQILPIANESIDTLLPNNSVSLKNDKSFIYIVYTLGGFLFIIFIIIIIFIIKKMTKKMNDSIDY